jgi:hypothetical protein
VVETHVGVIEVAPEVAVRIVVDAPDRQFRHPQLRRSHLRPQLHGEGVARHRQVKLLDTRCALQPQKASVPESQCFKCHPELKQKFAAAYKDKYGKEPSAPNAEDKK